LPTFALSEETYVFERMWPTLQQSWYFNYAVSGADVNNDNQVGMEEVLYILQKVAGLR